MAAVPQIVISAVQAALPTVAPAAITAFLVRFTPQVLLLAGDLTQKGIDLVIQFVDEFLDAVDNDPDDRDGSPPSSDDDDGNGSDDRVISSLKGSSTKLPRKGKDKCTVYVRTTKNPEQAQLDFNQFPGATKTSPDGKLMKTLTNGRVAVLYKSTKHMRDTKTIAIQRPNRKAIVKFRYPEPS